MSKDKKSSTAAFKQKFPQATEDNARNHSTPKESEVPPQENEDPVIKEAHNLPYAELEAQFKAAQDKVGEYWDRILRMQAEQENIERRAARDVAQAHDYGLKKFTLELLPVVDNLERAVDAHLADDAGAGSLLDGLKLTLKMFYAAFAKFGIHQINPQGDAFNPELHQAVSTVESQDTKSGTVASVLQKGYTLNQRLIRPALVTVAK